MTDIQGLAGLIPLFPIIGAFIFGMSAVFGDKFFKGNTVRVVSVFSPLMIFISFAIGLIYFAKIIQLPVDSRVIHEVVFPWFKSALFVSNIGFALDPLSIIMVLIVSGVSFLIHVYSIGYMRGDPGYSRFFSYLNLFTGMMLILVMADNLLLMFVGWEGVGLCSYLLIGFWYKDINNSRAGMKAFIVNRIGDFAFIIGMFTMFWVLGNATGIYSFDFSFLNSNASVLAKETILGFPAPEFICIMFFIGATGKSAQIPLYTWLPDAMAGPTPVSALIHAATMVTAGVFMIGRLGGLFMQAPIALTVVAIIGGFTALFAATIALTQNDIKKVLAYSTVSQLGYMFLAMGVGAFSAGIFHLMTHAFFKGLLFLGSGSVILGMHHDQDMRHMGGLAPRMKITGRTFLIGVLAISGIFPFAGFFSKDEILFNTFLASHGSIGPLVANILYTLGIVTAALTAFYMFRQYFMTFSGEFRGSPKDDHGHHGAHKLEDVHESPKVVTIPLMILALLSAVAGFFNLPEVMGGGAWFHHFLASVWPAPKGDHSQYHSLEISLAALSVTVALVSVGVSYIFYRKKKELPGKVVSKIPKIHQTLYNKYYVDELYDKIAVQPVLSGSRGIGWFDKYIVDAVVNGVGSVTKYVSKINGWIDANIVDGAVNGLSNLVLWAGGKIRKIQTGYLYNYFYYAVGGAMIIAIIMIIL